MLSPPAIGRLPRRGVTLPELLAAVALTAIILSVAIPRLVQSNVWGGEGKAAAKNLAANLRLARRMAVDHGAANPLGYRLDGFTSTYRLYDLAAGAYVGDTQGLPQGWRFEEATYTVTFNPYGAVSGYAAAQPKLIIRKGAERWAASFDTATGYVWHEGL